MAQRLSTSQKGHDFAYFWGPGTSTSISVFVSKSAPYFWGPGPVQNLYLYLYLREPTFGVQVA